MLGQTILNRPLPNLFFSRHTTPSGSSRSSTKWRWPNDVVHWESFSEDIINHRLHYEDQRMEDNFTFSTDLPLSDESSVTTALDVNVYHILRRLPIGARLGTSWSIATEGEPDRIFYKTHTTRTRQHEKETIIAIEIKTRWVLDNPGNLIETFRRKGAAFKPFLQLFQYLAKVKYGVLTTYCKTWFVKVETTTQQHKTMYISPALEHTTTNPSILRCYAAIIDLALIGQQSQGSRGGSEASGGGYDYGDGGSSGGGGSSSSKGGSSTSKRRSTSSPDPVRSSQLQKRQVRSSSKIQSTRASKKIDFQEFELLQILGVGTTGRVLEANWRGQQVAVKCSDLSKRPKAERDLLNEVAIYRKLGSLQGLYLPRLLGSGYSTINFVIILELVGPVARLQDLSADERWKIVKGLQAIHHAGVLHNDIRQGNILEHHCQHGRRGFRFVDFAWAEKTTDKAKLDAEMDQLTKLLDLK